MKQNTELFIYDNIYFENGKKDQNEHPVVVVGHDDRDLYCFMMTSQTKHDDRNSPARNKYNQNVKYVRTIPGKNIRCNNNKEGLINTTMCFTVPIEEARLYSNFGYVTSSVAKDIIVRWAYQQNEIKDKRDWNYDKICRVFGIDESIKNDEMYKYTKTLMENFPEEVARQKKYACELRIYNETCYRIRKENRQRRQNNAPLLAFPAEPRLASDKDYLQAYSKEQQAPTGNSVFAEFAKQYEEQERIKEAEANAKQEHINNLRDEINRDIIKLQEYKQYMMDISSNNSLEEASYEEEQRVGRRAM